ncbi:MAG: SRPBCC family protein [Bdellovibrionaceae bacterium]|nr:SRPBCC family protein [Pseudobdellovibrionaceae bacterium]NUM57990.1 SRPBCC family protein [Pseudobdellovibrionaceae bacterium]
MAKASITEVFKCTPEELYKIVTDYARYPEFLSEVKKCEVVKVEGNNKLVEYQVAMIKTVNYKLQMHENYVENGITLVNWEFVSGDMFKSLKGQWKIEPEGDHCRATYEVEANFNMFVPGPIANTLVSVSMPNMISSYHKRIKQLYGK